MFEFQINKQLYIIIGILTLSYPNIIPYYDKINAERSNYFFVQSTDDGLVDDTNLIENNTINPVYMMNRNSLNSTETNVGVENKTIISLVAQNNEQREVYAELELLKEIILSDINNRSLQIKLANVNSLDSQTCNTIDGTSSVFLNLYDDIPCSVYLFNNNQNITIDFDFQIVQHDDVSSIEEYYNNKQSPPSKIILEAGEYIGFSTIGGREYDYLSIYLVDKNIASGDIINLNENDFSRVYFDQFIFSNLDFFKVPDIDDGVSTWRMVVSYVINDELESYYIADDVDIE